MGTKVKSLRQTRNKDNEGNQGYKKIPFWFWGTGNEPIKFKRIKEQLPDTVKSAVSNGNADSLYQNLQTNRNIKKILQHELC